MLLPKFFFQFLTLSFDISQTNKARKLRLRSKEAPWNSLSRPHVVSKFSLRKNSQNIRSKEHPFLLVVWCKFYSDPLLKKLNLLKNGLSQRHQINFIGFGCCLCTKNGIVRNAVKTSTIFIIKKSLSFFMAQIDSSLMQIWKIVIIFTCHD